MLLLKNKKYYISPLVLFMLAAISTTVLAYYFSVDKSITTTFELSEIQSNITEDFDKNTKSDVIINNSSEVPIYIRVSLIANWSTDDGQIYGKAPVEGIDYVLDIDDSTWVYKDGFYYYKEPVAYNESTSVLVNSCEPIKDNQPDGYHFRLDVISDTIQAEPTNAIIDSWGVTLDSNKNIQ